MQRLNAKKGGFVVPLEQKPKEVTSSSIIGFDGTISIFGIEISRINTSYSNFYKDMLMKETDFVKNLEQ